MMEAVKQGRQFGVFVTESQPDNAGRRMAKDLQALGIPCTVILTQLCSISWRVNAVMLALRESCENGGIINKIETAATWQLAEQQAGVCVGGKLQVQPAEFLSITQVFLSLFAQSIPS